jgi:hypothetical protein
VSYVVVTAPRVSLTVSRYSASHQAHFRAIVRILADNPYPSPDFAPIEERTSREGRRYFQYFDGIVPLVLQYRVYEPDVDGQSGVVWLSRAIPLT